jgi:MFS family permease
MSSMTVAVEAAPAPQGLARRAARALVPALPRSVWILQAGAFTNALGSGLVFPFVLIYLHDVRGFGLGTAGFVAGTFGFVGIGVTPIAGSLVDRVGPQVVLRSSLGILALGYGLFPFIRSPWQAFLFMAVAGIGNGGFWPSQSALVNGLTPANSRHRTSAVARAVYNGGLAMGGAVGGLVIASGATSGFTLLFLLDASTYLIFAGLTLLVPEPERRTPQPAGDATAPAGYRAVIRDRIFMAVIGLNVVYVAAAYAPFESALPLFARSELGLSPRLIGLVFLTNMLGVVFLQLPVAKLLEGKRRMAALAVMTLIMGLAFVLLVGASALVPAAAAWVVVLAAFVFASGECVLGPAQGPLAVQLAPLELRGRYMAVLTNSYAVGFAIGPPVAALLLSVSPNGLWILAAGTVLVAGAAGLALDRRLPEELRRTPRT